MVIYNFYTVVCFSYFILAENRSVFLSFCAKTATSKKRNLRGSFASLSTAVHVYIETQAPVIRPCATDRCLISKYFLHLSSRQSKRQRFKAFKLPTTIFLVLQRFFEDGRGGGRSYEAGGFPWQQHSLFLYSFHLTRWELRISMEPDREKSTVTSYNYEQSANRVPLRSSKGKLLDETWIVDNFNHGKTILKLLSSLVNDSAHISFNGEFEVMTILFRKTFRLIFGISRLPEIATCLSRKSTPLNNFDLSPPKQTISWYLMQYFKWQKYLNIISVTWKVVKAIMAICSSHSVQWTVCYNCYSQ